MKRKGRRKARPGTTRRARSTRPKDCPYAGKGGLKLEFALDAFGISVEGKVAADLGAHIGGFTDCLLQRGAAKVYSVDTAYGLLAYKLRVDERVVVIERTNALFWDAPEPCDIVVMDLGWTRQKKALPVAAKTVKPDGVILSLVKPQYEADKKLVEAGVLEEGNLDVVMAQVRSEIPQSLDLTAEALSPLKGSGGNSEVWLLLRPGEA